MVIKKRIGLFLSALLVVSIIPINYYVKNRAAEKYQTIKIDGHVRDWKMLPKESRMIVMSYGGRFAQMISICILLL